MEQASDDRADQLVCVYVDADKKNQLCKKEAAAEILVDCGPGALNLTEEPEGENAYGEADQGDDYSELSDPRQDIIIFNSNGGTGGHQNRKVCQVTTAAGSMGAVGVYQLTALR